MSTFYGADFEQLQAEDPEVASILTDELARLRGGLQLIASENFTSPAVLAAFGFDVVQQVRRGLPGQALLRRLRGRRPGRAARHRPGQGTVWRAARQPPAALGGQCQLRRVRGAPAAR